MPACLRGVHAACGVDVQGDRTVLALAHRVRNRVVVQVVSGKAPSGVPLVAAMYASESIVRLVKAPYASVRKARRVFATLLDVQLPFPLEDCEAVFMEPVPAVGGGVEALAVAARRVDIQRRLDALQAQGIDPVILDHEPSALWTRALEEVPADPSNQEGIRVVIYAGVDRWAMAVGRGPRMLGGHALGVADAAETIQRLVTSYLAPGTGRVEWVMTGPQAGTPAVKAVLASCRDRWPSVEQEVPDAGGFLARALAVRSLSSGPLRCNLRPATLEHAFVQQRRKRRLLKTLVMFLLAGVVLLGTAEWIRFQVEARLAEFDSRVVRQVDRIAGYPVTLRGDDAVQEARKSHELRLRKMEVFSRPFRPSLMNTVMPLVEAASSAGMTLESLQVNRDRVNLAGHAPDWPSPQKLARILEQAGYVPTVDRRDAGTDEQVPFIIEGRRRGVTP
ncbi:MAG: hypothetical protein A2498_16455 [Lentisphaerae bacterium RIFOXYC12_FULL_60_16]|nr:MAG: hypothetical protein A2498_16455 [Lentisphaerae bacterium RIFOXYC12_FULL_60_16]OGV85427.1 MAG: hypothetical protein A2340_03195 [Lentisphaerae bacterium RIFOXYB12_FULL_60_10]